MENRRDRIKEQGKTEEWPEQVREEHRRLAHQSAESFWQELEQDFRKTSLWLKSHSNEESLLLASILIGGISVGVARSSAAGLAELEKAQSILRGEQIASETNTFGRLGAESYISTKVRFGNRSHEQFLIDPSSPQGRRVFNQEEGLGSSFHK
jgi:hypothetical protein